MVVQNSLKLIKNVRNSTNPLKSQSSGADGRLEMATTKVLPIFFFFRKQPVFLPYFRSHLLILYMNMIGNQLLLSVAAGYHNIIGTLIIFIRNNVVISYAVFKNKKHVYNLSILVPIIYILFLARTLQGSCSDIRLSVCQILVR